MPYIRRHGAKPTSTLRRSRAGETEVPAGVGSRAPAVTEGNPRGSGSGNGGATQAGGTPGKAAGLLLSGLHLALARSTEPPSAGQQVSEHACSVHAAFPARG